MRHRHNGEWHKLPIAILFSVAFGSAASAQDATTPAAETAAPATSQWPDPATAPAEILDISRIQTSLLIDGTNARDRAVVVGDR